MTLKGELSDLATGRTLTAASVRAKLGVGVARSLLLGHL